MKAVILIFILSPILAFAASNGACYSRSNCKGSVLYRFTDQTTAEECTADGGSSIKLVGTCLNVWTTTTQSSGSAAPSCFTGTCTSASCECCTGPYKKYGEVCP